MIVSCCRALSSPFPSLPFRSAFLRVAGAPHACAGHLRCRRSLSGGRVLQALGEEIADVLERAQSGEEISEAEWGELREGLDTTLATLNAELEALNETLTNVAAMTGSLRAQVEGNDHILDEISSLITETDDLMQGLKRHWLLRGAFEDTPLPVSETIDDPLLAPPGEVAP